MWDLILIVKPLSLRTCNKRLSETIIPWVLVYVFVYKPNIPGITNVFIFVHLKNKFIFCLHHSWEMCHGVVFYQNKCIWLFFLSPFCHLYFICSKTQIHKNVAQMTQIKWNYLPVGWGGGGAGSFGLSMFIKLEYAFSFSPKPVSVTTEISILILLNTNQFFSFI